MQSHLPRYGDGPIPRIALIIAEPHALHEIARLGIGHVCRAQPTPARQLEQAVRHDAPNGQRLGAIPGHPVVRTQPEERLQQRGVTPLVTVDEIRHHSQPTIAQSRDASAVPIG